MNLTISRHGGRCCGIKHIYGFYRRPDAVLPAVSQKEDLHFYSDHASPGKAISGIGPCPKETLRDRLVRYLEFLDKRRPQGIVEAVLATGFQGDIGTCQVELWRPVLEELGFTLSVNAKNSNSGNTIYVFHRISTTKRD